MRLGGMTKPLDAIRSLWKPLAAIAASVALSALLLVMFDYPIGASFRALWEASFKNMRVFGNMLNKACPLLFTGVAVAIANRGSVFNIGAEGQFLLGAIAATWVGITFATLPGPILMILMILAGALAGAIWAFLPGFLKAKMNVSEVITTIMLNYIALHIVGILVRTVMRDRNQAEPQSYAIAKQGYLPYVLENTKLHPGFLIGCLVAVIVFILLFKNHLGFSIRAVGLNSIASKYAGINVNRTMIVTMLISGALAGMGGAFELAGSSHYLYESISPGYGYTAIAVSVLAGDNPIGVIFSALLFGFLEAGSSAMQRNVGLSASFADIVQGIIIIFVAIATVRQRGIRRKKPTQQAASHKNKEVA